jgi:hypothetical protein
MSHDLFPSLELNATEEGIIAEAFANPTVVKYLQFIANGLIKDIVFGEPAINETAESYLRRQANAKGRLEAINTLLQIQTA